MPTPCLGAWDKKMAMATPAMRTGFLASPLPRLLCPILFPVLRISQPQSRKFLLPLLSSLALAVPTSFQLGLPPLPSLLEGIWESILKAVPKKKTSHSKKRHRQMAGKALKDVTSLCVCPGCGRTKKMHHLCPNCASSKCLIEESSRHHADSTL